MCFDLLNLKALRKGFNGIFKRADFQVAEPEERKLGLM